MKLFNWQIQSEKQAQTERTELALSVKRDVTKAAMNALLQMQNVVWKGVSYPDYDIERSFKNAFAENAVFFSIVDKIAEKFSHIPRNVYKPETSKKLFTNTFRTKSLDENLADGDLAKLLQNPNTYEGQDSFFYKIGVSYKSTFEVFIWKNRGGTETGKPVELYVLPPWCVTVVTDGSLFGVKEYRLKVGANEETIPVTDIIHWKKPTLALDQQGTQLRAFNPLKPGRKVLTQMDSITDSAVGMYQNGGARGALYNKSLDELDTEQGAKVDQLIDTKINRNSRKGAVVALQGEWGYLDIGSSSVDMELLKAEEAVIKKMCFLLGYPYEMYSGDATHANREQSMEYLLTQTIMPMVDGFDGELNRALLPDFKEKGFIKSDMSEMPEMQSMRLKSAIAINQMDYISPNEKRQVGGWEPRTDDYMDEIWIAGGKIPMSEALIGQPMDNTNAKDYHV